MKNRKFPVVVLSLVFAFLVWALVNLGNQFQTTIDVPVKIENLREDQAIAVPLPTHVLFKIQGTGWQLLQTIISPNLNYTIDFKSLSKKDTLFTDKDLNERVNIPASIRVFETIPETVIVRTDQKITKRVPLVPIVRTEYRNGFGLVGTITTTPESISIVGARSLLQKIHRWKTEPVTLSDINSPVSIRVNVVDSLPFEISREISDAIISFDVQPIAERTITDLFVDIVQTPENRNVVLIPQKIEIIVRSGVNTISLLTEKDFYAYVDYKSILLDTSGMVQPIIQGPSNVQIVQLKPEKIQYVVRK